MANQREILFEGASAKNIKLNRAAQKVMKAFGGQIAIILLVNNNRMEATLVADQGVSRELQGKLLQDVPDLTLTIIKEEVGGW